MLFEPGIFVQSPTIVLPGEFTSGPWARGQAGAAGAARVPRVLAAEHPWAGFGGAAPGSVVARPDGRGIRRRCGAAQAVAGPLRASVAQRFDRGSIFIFAHAFILSFELLWLFAGMGCFDKDVLSNIFQPVFAGLDRFWPNSDTVHLACDCRKTLFIKDLYPCCQRKLIS